MIPETYEQWRQCITIECGIPLTTLFVTQRLAIWRDLRSEETQRFRRLYGDVHWRAITHWFEQAARELNAGVA
jgi:hypothetical protein